MPLFGWETEGSAGEQETRETLLDFCTIFEACHAGSWSEWTTIAPTTRDKFSSVTRGCGMHDLIVDRARSLFKGQTGVEICEANFFKLYFRDRLVVRFKKVTASHKVELWEATPNTAKWFRNADMSEVRRHCTRLNVGYYLVGKGEDEKLGDIVVTCQFKDEVLFSYSMLERPVEQPREEKVESSIVLPPPPPPKGTTFKPKNNRPDSDRNAGA